MVDFKYKGRRLDNGEWIKGDLLVQKYRGRTRYYIGYVQNGSIEGFEVDSVTVCISTLLNDAHGDSIWYGDIIVDTITGKTYVVSYECSHRGGFSLIENGHYAGVFGELTEPMYCEVVGNVYDNPELLDNVSRK